jgi:hypothetical protein
MRLARSHCDLSQRRRWDDPRIDIVFLGDPASGTDALLDVAPRDGKIAVVGAGL